MKIEMPDFVKKAIPNDSKFHEITFSSLDPKSGWRVDGRLIPIPFQIKIPEKKEKEA